MELELINEDLLDGEIIIGRDVKNIELSLSDLVTQYYSPQEGPREKIKDDILQLLSSKHEVSYNLFHGLRRAFRDRDTYWVHRLNKAEALEKIEEGKVNHPHSKCRFLKFTFDNNNNAFFHCEPVGKFEFDSGISCYHEVLLEYIFNKYDNIYIVKGKNELSTRYIKPGDIQGKNYQVLFTIAMLKCEVKNPKGPSEDEKFDYFDVVHDPGGNC